MDIQSLPINEQVRTIKREFHLMMNGVVSQSMREKGIAYRTNFGVELPRLQQFSATLPHTSALASALWKEQVRECRLLATMLMPSSEFEADMAELAIITKRLDFQLEQVQDFTPTPMTVSTEAWYSGYHPYTLEPVYSAKTQKEKLAQRQYFFWYKPEERHNIEQSLRRIGRTDLIADLCPYAPHHVNTNKSNTNRANADNRAMHNSQKPDGRQRGRNRRNK